MGLIFFELPMQNFFKLQYKWFFLSFLLKMYFLWSGQFDFQLMLKGSKSFNFDFDICCIFGPYPGHFHVLLLILGLLPVSILLSNGTNTPLFSDTPYIQKSTVFQLHVCHIHNADANYRPTACHMAHHITTNSFYLIPILEKRLTYFMNKTMASLQCRHLYQILINYVFCG